MIPTSSSCCYPKVLLKFLFLLNFESLFTNFDVGLMNFGTVEGIFYSVIGANLAITSTKVHKTNIKVNKQALKVKKEKEFLESLRVFKLHSSFCTVLPSSPKILYRLRLYQVFLPALCFPYNKEVSKVILGNFPL